jgi:hypothetical protein
VKIEAPDLYVERSAAGVGASDPDVDDVSSVQLYQVTGNRVCRPIGSEVVDGLTVVMNHAVDEKGDVVCFVVVTLERDREPDGENPADVDSNVVGSDARCCTEVFSNFCPVNNF